MLNQIPAGQTSHEVDPSLDAEVPIGHSVHTVLPYSLYDPIDIECNSKKKRDKGKRIPIGQGSQKEGSEGLT